MTSLDIGAVCELYPHMRFARQWNYPDETSYQLGQCRAYVDTLAGAPLLPDYRARLQLVSLTKGAQATTAIEGNTLSDAEVDLIASGARLSPSQEYQEREVRNILDALNGIVTDIVHGGKVEKITPELLLKFHRKIGHDLGESFEAVPGQWAQKIRVVGPYRPPRPEHVPLLVAKLCEWLQQEFHYPNQRFRDAVVQAIVTHVYVEWIHPFDDGNGRTGRLVEFYILLRAGLPTIATHLLANHYNLTRSEYYRQLQRAHQTRDLSHFIEYAVTGLRDGLRDTLGKVRENAIQQMWQVLVYNRFGARQIGQVGVFKRQRAVALSLPLGHPLTIPDIRTLTPQLQAEYERAKSPRTVLRDLNVLEEMGLITRESGLIRANSSLLEATIAERRPSVVPPTPPAQTQWRGPPPARQTAEG